MAFLRTRVEPVGEGRELDEFIRFRWQVYRGNPVWIPPVIQDDKKFLSGRTLFFKHCAHRLFAARENGRIVATAACFYDRNFVEHWKDPAGFLGYFEALPGKDAAVAALFQNGEDWLRGLGAERVYGPVNGSIANPAGLLMNAYNLAPACLMPYNPSYYHAYFRRAGYEPHKELLALTMDLMDGSLRRKIGFIMKRAGRSEVTVRKFDKSRFREDSLKLAKIYTETFSRHWGFSPLPEEELCELLESLRPVLDYDLILFAEYAGKVVGFVLGLPDFNPVVKKLDGNLSVFSLPAFFRLKKTLREARIVAWGADAEWRGKNVVPVLATNAYNALLRKGYTTCENSWILRENTSSQRAAYKFHSRVYKNYMVYAKTLASNA